MKIKLALWSLASLMCLPAPAQFSAAVQGTVLDASSAAVPDAKVRLTNIRTGITAETVSNATGFYRFSSLAPSDYEVKVEAAGFRGSTVALALTSPKAGARQRSRTRSAWQSVFPARGHSQRNNRVSVGGQAGPCGPSLNVSANENLPAVGKD